MAFVYLLRERPYPGETTIPWTKIGYTKNPVEWRLNANLKRGNPRDLEVAVAHEFETEALGLSAELAAHNHFRDRLHQKEWFSVSWQEVEAWCDSQGYKKSAPKIMQSN